MNFEKLNVTREGGVLFAEIAAPPMNLLGPELVGDLIALIQQAEADEAIQVLVFKSADPDYFISHVDVTRINEYREQVMKMEGATSLALLFRRISTSRLVTIAQIEALNPERIVVVPDLEAGCSLADGCPPDQFRAFIDKHPGHTVVSYINCSAAVKAMSDVICTSSNAVKIVQSIPKDQPIIFAPDKHLGRYVIKQTGRDMVLWQGTCIVHATFPARRLAEAKAEHPRAKVVAHPECPESVLAMADFIGSTSALIEWCVASDAAEFIVMTESGVNYSLQKLAPHKRFYFVANENCNCSECPYMKMNSLEKLRNCLRDLEPRVEISADIMQRALAPLERMLAVK